MMRNVSSCCSYRSSTLYLLPAMVCIFFFTSSVLALGFNFSSKAVSMPCIPKRLRAKETEVRM